MNLSFIYHRLLYSLRKNLSTAFSLRKKVLCLRYNKFVSLGLHLVVTKNFYQEFPIVITLLVEMTVYCLSIYFYQLVELTIK